MPIRVYTDVATARDTVLRRVSLDEVTVPARVREGIAARFGEELTPAQAVERVLADVRRTGDAALRDWTARLDGVERDQLAVPAAAIEAAIADLSPAMRTALETAIDGLTSFHSHQARTTWTEYTAEGMRGQMVVPLQRVGLYVPGGVAPLPSSLLHAAIPARVAGVEELVVCSPPRRDTGLPHPLVLAAAHMVGVQQVFALGGAQAIAAMAYGTATVPQVDKIAGPGNLFVVLAMRAVYGLVGIVSLPGPTETMVIADNHANPAYVAADLLAQAEHELASAILLTPSPVLCEAVQTELARQLGELPAANAHAAREALAERSGIVLTDTLPQAFELANAYGPEHLCLLLAEPWDYIGMVRNAGGIFLGEQSFEVLGDYVAGPSHIMPTGGTARYSSPVNVDDFRKVISLLGLNTAALARIGPAAMGLATAEGLHAHAAAVRVRLYNETQTGAANVSSPEDEEQ